MPLMYTQQVFNGARCILSIHHRMTSEGDKYQGEQSRKVGLAVACQVGEGEEELPV